MRYSVFDKVRISAKRSVHVWTVLVPAHSVGVVRTGKKHCISYQLQCVSTPRKWKILTIWKRTLATSRSIKSMSTHLSGTGAVIRSILCSFFRICAICSSVAYPESCRHPEHMIHCIEMSGILVTDVAENCGQSNIFMTVHTVTWYGIIFFHHDQRAVISIKDRKTDQQEKQRKQGQVFFGNASH